MQITASYTFDAPAEKVWAHLMDVDIVAACVPGCDRLEPLGDDRYRASLTLSVASISGSYEALLHIADQRPPHGYRLLVEGKGRPGFVNGATTITLVPHGQQTIVEVAGDVQVGGAIARLGQRLLGSVSKMMMDRFFGCLKTRVGSLTSDA